NLTLACTPCNLSKGSGDIGAFLAHDPKRLARILAQAKAPLKDAAAINSIRHAIGNRLKEFGLPASFWSGGRTKHNRIKQGYPKKHWLDAVCVGESGLCVHIAKTLAPLIIAATGRGSRQMCRVDRFGFPRTGGKSKKVVKGFKTGDMVKAVVGKGKKIGSYVGRVAVRKSGSFNIKTKDGTVQGISWKYCSLLQSADGYNCNMGGSVSSST
ncbi:MAG: HNH endonuclease, partial [Pseudomonadota bacterium]